MKIRLQRSKRQALVLWLNFCLGWECWGCSWGGEGGSLWQLRALFSTRSQVWSQLCAVLLLSSPSVCPNAGLGW